MPKLDGIEYKELFGLSVDKENSELFFNDSNHWVGLLFWGKINIDLSIFF